LGRESHRNQFGLLGEEGKEKSREGGGEGTRGEREKNKI